MQVKCIKKFRDKHNKIIGYRIVAANGQSQDVKAERLKEVIASGNLDVVNLTLTKDGRLVDKTEKQSRSVPATNQSIDKVEECTDSTPQNEQLIINKEMKAIEEICNRLGIAYDEDQTEIEPEEYDWPHCVQYVSQEIQLTLDKVIISILVHDNHWQIDLCTDNGLYMCANNFDGDESLIDSIKFIKSIKDKFNMPVSEYRKNPDILCDIAGLYMHGDDGMAYAFSSLLRYANKIGIQNSFETYIMDKIKRLNTKDNRDKLKKRVMEINKKDRESNVSKFSLFGGPTNIDELLLLCAVTNIKPNKVRRDDIRVLRMEFSSNVKPKNNIYVTASELNEIIKSGYNTFLRYICLNEPLIIDFRKILCRLDLSLYTHIGNELLKADEELRKKFNQNGTYSESCLQLDVSNKRVYDQLVKVINDKDIQANCQYDKFICNLINSINNRPATYLDIPKYND